MIVGGAFGLISFLQCFGIFGTSALGAALVNVSPVLMFIQRFVSRLMVGVLAALVYRGMTRTKAPLYLRGAVTGFSAAFFNTLFFMTLLVLFFGHTDKLAGPIAEKGVLMYIITSVGINAKTHDPDHGYWQHQYQDSAVRRNRNVQILADVDEYFFHV